MVRGIDSFRTKFMDYTDCYTVIGGAACDILMSEEDLSFRSPWIGLASSGIRLLDDHPDTIHKKKIN